MRIIIHGVGAVGGTIAVNLAKAGQEVVGIARGAQLAAIQAHGLTLRTPTRTDMARFECVASPGEIDWRADDVIILTVKSQHTEAALNQLRAAGVWEQPIFCAQNGVENERVTLRRFPNVHAMTVMLPADFMTPGEVVGFGAPKDGFFDIGLFPAGSNQVDHDLVEIINRTHLAAFVSDRVMASKYGKLILNLRNICAAALGEEAHIKPIVASLVDEAKAVFLAAGIDWRDVSMTDPRRKDLMTIQSVPGITRTGSSTTQSLARGAGSVETDYLNGEISMLGRMHGVPTPGNDYFLRLASRMLAEGLAPGSVDHAEVAAALGL